MEYSFKRAYLLPVTFLICGITMLLMAFIQIAIGSFNGFITGALSILFLGQAGWNFTTPIVKISNGIFHHKKGLIANNDFELKNVERVELKNSSRVDLIFFNGHKEKIYLRNMRNSDREEFRKIIGELVEQSKTY